MITLFDLTYIVARELGEAREGHATGGSTTTIVDTVNRVEDDHYFVGGTAWILTGTNAGKYATITAYDGQTKTVTFSPALASAVVAGDKYAVSKARYPLWLFIQKANTALRDLGPLPTVDTATILTETGKTEYTLPASASLDLLNVFIQTQTQENDNRYRPLYNWVVERTPTGSPDVLVLYEEPTPARKLKLVFMAQHPEIHLAADKINEMVHPDLVVYRAAYLCLRWYSDKTRTRDFAETMNHLLARAEIALIHRPITRPRRQAKLTLIGRNRYGPTGISDRFFS